MRDEPKRDALLHRFPALGRQRVVREDDGPWLQRLFAGDELGDGIAEPANCAVVSEHERFVDRLGQARRARRELLRQFELACFVVERARRRRGVRDGRDLARHGRVLALHGRVLARNRRRWACDGQDLQDLEAANVRQVQRPRERRAGGRIAILRRFCLCHRASFEIVVFNRRPAVRGAVAIHWATPTRRGSLPDRLGAANAGSCEGGAANSGRRAFRAVGLLIEALFPAGGNRPRRLGARRGRDPSRRAARSLIHGRAILPTRNAIFGIKASVCDLALFFP